MPRPNQGRGGTECITTVRLSPEERKDVEKAAKLEQVTNSDVIRRALQAAGITRPR